jgi:aryl-alcohol dehydrogenase-like predicted oxidoreductase
MQERQMGRSGLWVSAVTLGTMTFGNQADRDAAFAIMDRAYEAGIRTFDTADVYPLGGGPERRGETERIIGEWLRTRGVRDEMVIATKAHGAMGDARHHRGLGRRHLREAVEQSCERLGIDAVDLYQAHQYDPDTPMEETLSAFDDLLHAGLIHYWGVSNWRAYQLARALGLADQAGMARPVSVQPRYNALFRAIEDELVPLCIQEGIGIIPYNPLAGGMLTGRYRPGQAIEPGTRFGLGHGAGNLYRDRYWQPATLRVVEGIRREAERRGIPMAGAALRWVMDQPGITSPILGASRQEQLDTSLAGLDLTLPAPLRARFDDAWNRLPRRFEPR